MADVSGIVGTVTNPLPSAYSGNIASGNWGFIIFFTNIIRVVFVVAGIYAFINFIIAGFQYMSSAGDTKALTQALNRIWYSLLGLVVVVASFALASFAGWLIFGHANFILNPTIYGPGQ